MTRWAGRIKWKSSSAHTWTAMKQSDDFKNYTYARCRPHFHLPPTRPGNIGIYVPRARAPKTPNALFSHVTDNMGSMNRWLSLLVVNENVPPALGWNQRGRSTSRPFVFPNSTSSRNSNVNSNSNRNVNSYTRLFGEEHETQSNNTSHRTAGRQLRT